MKHLRKILTFFLFLFTFIYLKPLTAQADIGPKSCITIQIEGLDNEVYFGTLLSQRATNGPLDAVDETNFPYKPSDKHYDILNAFAEYDDIDGYFFLPEIFECRGNDTFGWGYMPPSPFKVLLYFPEYDTFIVSDIYKEYAFDSYYLIDLGDIDITSMDTPIVTATRNYPYFKEFLALLVRIVLTILIELIIAKAFYLTEKKQTRLLIIVNVITQIFLNVYLNIVNYNSGSLSFLLSYFSLEVIIFLIEAVLYTILLPIVSENAPKKPVLVIYAFMANLISFMMGVFLSFILTEFF